MAASATRSVISIDLAAIRRGDQSADIPLQAFDRLSIKQVSGWTEQDQVTLKGEVRFPGTYTIQPGETLHSVIDRAGGLTEFAFVEGSVFTRTELKVREQEQLDRLAVRLRTEIAEVALMGVRAQQGGAPSAISVGETLLHQLTDREGRRPAGDRPQGGAAHQAGLERRRHSAQWRRTHRAEAAPGGHGAGRSPGSDFASVSSAA